MKDGKIDDASELEKVIGKDNKEEGNIVKDKFKNLNGAANAVANAEIIVENNEEIQVFKYFNFHKDKLLLLCICRFLVLPFLSIPSFFSGSVARELRRRLILSNNFH